MPFDALLVLSFGGPDGPDDVRPFLSNVLRGRQVRPERVEQVVEQYMAFGGASPINEQNRELVRHLRARLDVPVYWGNRNWVPYLADTLREMASDGVQNAAVFVTSAYSSYSGCRQYQEDMAKALVDTGLSGVLRLTKLRPFYNHPGFVTPLSEGLTEAVAHHPGAPVLMSAHSIPVSMAATCDYADQLRQVSSHLATAAGVEHNWQLVFQSRSGPPSQPWLGPDVNEVIENLPGEPEAVIVTPIGFVSDHMEVRYDLDTAAAATARRRGIELVRTPTPGVHPLFVDMVGQLMAELDPTSGFAPVTVGGEPARPTPCPAGCCPPPPHR